LKKVLIISYSYPPSNAAAAQRPYFLAKYLKQNSFEPLVLTSNSTNSSLGNSEWATHNNILVIRTKKNKLAKLEASSNNLISISGHDKLSLIKTIKSKIISFIASSLLPKVMIPDKAFHWKKVGSRVGEKIILRYKPDIIFSTSPSVVNHLVAKKLASKFDIKWVADFRDCYYTGYLEERKWLRRYIDRKIERSIIKSADFLTFISPMMLELYRARYYDLKSNSDFIYNGFDEDEFNLIKEIKSSNKKIIIFYAGSFYKGVRNPIPLFKAMEYLLDQGKIYLKDFEIQIAGNFDASLLNELKGFKSLENLKLLGVIPRQSVLKKYKESNLLWLIIGDHISHYVGFPVKGYEYIGAQRPLLIFSPKPAECENIVNDLECGVILKNQVDDKSTKNNAILIFNIIESINNKSQIQDSKFDGRLKKYTRKEQTSLFSKIFNTILDDEKS